MQISNVKYLKIKITSNLIVTVSYANMQTRCWVNCSNTVRIQHVHTTERQFLNFEFYFYAVLIKLHDALYTFLLHKSAIIRKTPLD